MAIYALAGVAPVLGRDAWVTESASVIGDVVLGDATSIWFGAVVRGDYMPIRIGARTNIQDNAVVHITHETAATTIGDDVTVGHSAVVHGATIGHLCLIGMGAIILDGAVVGDGSFIAAGTLVTPGTILAPRSFVMGRPGKVVRQVDDTLYAWLAESAANYVRYAREFRDGCKKL
jgi:carbonic anhydrase/acetyltransferase-like protein (isoleucine patch superfamily)